MASTEIPIPREPTEDEALALFRAVEEKFPSKSLGDDKWYIVTVHNPNSRKKQLSRADDKQLAAMVGGNQPEFAPLLYKELIKRPEHTTPEQRQALMRRLREILFKLIIIIGVCKPLDAVFRIEAITRPEDKDYSFSRYKALSSRWPRTPLIRSERGGNAMKPIGSVAWSGSTAFTSTTCKVTTRYLRLKRTSVCTSETVLTHI